MLVGAGGCTVDSRLTSAVFVCSFVFQCFTLNLPEYIFVEL